MKTLIQNAILINEGAQIEGALLVQDEQIAAIIPQGSPLPEADTMIDAEGAYLIPGVIDDHVHFRDPGLTHKADIAHESRAAAAGGVTSVLDMPNVVPQTTTLQTWEERQQLGARECRVNYAYYLGATNDNLDEILHMDTTRIPAVKLFMGSSTGNMLVDREDALRNLFQHCPTLIMTHCEDTTRINTRMAEAQALWGDDPAVEHHPWIRDDEACYQSTSLAVRLAREEGARLHVAHLTTARELELFSPDDTRITAEACVAHLMFTDADYATLGTRIKCNPAVKSAADQAALRMAINDGRIAVVGTDHAPHLLSEKQGGSRKAVSGMPMVQYSLPTMLSLVSEGVLSIERLVTLMCHRPATLFGIQRRGFLRPGYQADLVLVRPQDWTVTPDDILSLCGWSPLEGRTLHHRVTHTWCNGHLVYADGHIDDNYRGQALTFQA